MVLVLVLAFVLVTLLVLGVTLISFVCVAFFIFIEGDHMVLGLNVGTVLDVIVVVAAPGLAADVLVRFSSALPLRVYFFLPPPASINVVNLAHVAAVVKAGKHIKLCIGAVV